jgi:adenine-specific DNA-methyltransferase
METMDGKSLDITEEKRNMLKEIIPEAFTEDKIDWEKLKATLGEDVEFKNERYVLNWAGKSDAFRVLQTPTTATLVPCAEESIGFDDTENIFIEGENLEVLKVLQKSYFGKIKMIYIDPPYNTGNDKFIYPDKFSETKEEYLSRVGARDENGYMTREGMFRRNSSDNGHYHSNWLSMVYPRIFLARNLLQEDGVIFISIDDNEVHNLRLLMNEVFGEENFISILIWKKKAGGGSDAKYIADDHEYVLIYAKNESTLPRLFVEMSDELREKYMYEDEYVEERGPYQRKNLHQTGIETDRPNLIYPIEAPDGTHVYPPTIWRWSKETFEKARKDGRIEILKNSKDEWAVYTKMYLFEDGEERKVKPRSILSNVGYKEWE